jgi:ubiquinone/menaquinone biosynthesis C-methylase UbiE
MAQSHDNSVKFPYSGHDWLDNHHAIKSRMRSDLISRLPLKAGDRILDLACGPGNWTLSAAERVGLHGSVLGIDCDPENLQKAEARRSSHPLKRAIRFEVGDITAFDTGLGDYDAIFLFNILSYLPSAQSYIERLCSLMKPTCQLVIKDSDLQSDFFWPVPYDLYTALIAAILVGSDRRLSGRYNPFFARELPRILNAIPQLRVATLSQAFSLVGDLTAEEREYVRSNAAMLASIADQNGADRAAAEWLGLFAEGERCVMNDPAFIYTTTEFVFQASLS